MAVANLYHVTETLIRLLERNVPRVVAGGAVNVVSRPPEALAGQTRAINIFLYHVAEDPNYRNQMPAGNHSRPVAATPMALILYFIVTAHHEHQSAFDASVEHEILGGALKTFHDFPYINAETAVPDAGPVMNPLTMGSSGVALEIALRPVTPEEALSFWSSEQNQTARLSAYYEVRTAFLEPEAPTGYPGVVRSIGAYALPSDAPGLSGSRSQVPVDPPATSGLRPSALPASPARPFALTPAEAEAGEAADLELTGSNLLTGTRRRLVLRHPDFARLDPPRRDLPVDPNLNAANGWSVAFTHQSVGVTFGSALTYRNADGTTATLPLYPGPYLLAVEAEKGAYEAGDRRQAHYERSNAVTVLRGAFLTAASAIAADDTFTLAVSPAFDLARDDGDEARELDIVLLIEGQAYTRVHDAADMAAGRFRVETQEAGGPPGPDGLTLYAAATVHVHAAFDTGVAAVRAVRLIVEGVDSQPFWLEVAP